MALCVFVRGYVWACFGHTRTFSLSRSGEGLKHVLELQWNSLNVQVLGVSGAHYRFDLKKPMGHRVSQLRVLRDEETMRFEDVQTDEMYRVTTNNFLAGGGDGFSAFLNHSSPTSTGKVDHECLVGYFGSRDVVSAHDRERGYDIDWVDHTDDVLAEVDCKKTTRKTLSVDLKAKLPIKCGRPLRIMYKAQDSPTYVAQEGPTELDQKAWSFRAHDVGLAPVEITIYCPIFNSNPLPDGVAYNLSGATCTFPDDPANSVTATATITAAVLIPLLLH